MSVGSLGRSLNLFLSRIQATIENVIVHTAIEEHCFLRYNSYLLTQRVQRNAANILTIDGDAAIGYIIEAGQETCHGGFAGTGGTNKGNHFTGLNVKAYIIKHLFTGVIAKGNIIKANLALNGG